MYVLKEEKKVQTAGKTPPSQGYIVYDPSLCTGCLSCEAACSAYHGGGTVRPSMSLITIEMDIFSGRETNFEPKPCLQCDEPQCLLACPVEAIAVDPETGARVVEETLCIGCKSCIEACGEAFTPPRIRFNTESNTAVKCDLCGGDPQCVRWCPNGALRYVNRGEFLEQGGVYKQTFTEPYTKDFGPDYDAFKGNELSRDKLYRRNKGE